MSITASVSSFIDRSPVFELPRRNRWWSLVDKIESQSKEFEDRTDLDLRRETLGLRYRAKSREPLSQLLVEAFALACVASHRHLNLSPYREQLYGAIAMHFGQIAEMQTGEGKTLTATLPLYLASLPGRGAHLATANDYLARRDAEQMGRMFEQLGVTIGVIQSDSSTTERRRAYQSDITYGTAKEFGFDFLRGRLASRDTREALPDFNGQWSSQEGENPGRQRTFEFALIDEADSILIDEARTPLIVSSSGKQDPTSVGAVCKWAEQHISLFEESDLDWPPHRRGVWLNDSGRKRVRALATDEKLKSFGLLELYERVENAIYVHCEFQKDQHYVVRDREIVIVDENTGRLAEGRRWRDGIHQAIEAKEGLSIGIDAAHAARITIQGLMQRYRRLAGMSGTAAPSRTEFRSIYELGVVRVPTHRPEQRRQWQDQVLANRVQKWDAIANEVQNLVEQERPVLVGTRTIERSLELSQALTQRGIDHQVLNACQRESEAEIVAQAGQRARVTVATNMAGRGTDIRLGQGVAELGGLHVIISELHESERIDRQLIGRCGRQGDPGSFRFFYCWEDNVLRSGFGVKSAKRLLSAHQNDNPSHQADIFRKAQRKIERLHFRDRKNLMMQERERMTLHEQLGEDPFLDSPI